MNSNFFIPQAPAVRNIIHSIWEVERSVPFNKELIIPKGIIEIIFNFSSSGNIPAEVNRTKYHLPRCFINGFNTAPIILELPAHQHFLGIRFQPLAVKKIFKVPACEFSDVPVDLTLLSSEFNAVWHHLAEQIGFDAKVAAFVDWIKKKFIDWDTREKLINDFLCGPGQHNLSVGQLAAWVCYSPRQLSRKMREATGLPTEEILLYKKYLHSVDLIHHTDLDLTRVAYDAHFSDQSHFIKSFRQFAQMTPGEYKRNKSHLKGHLYEIVR